MQTCTADFSIQRRTLTEINLDDAFMAYASISKGLANNIVKKRLSEDLDGFPVFQRYNAHSEKWDTIIIFRDGYAYVYGGDSPERFEKNVRLNFELFMLGYDVHFKTLGIPLDGLFKWAVAQAVHMNG